MGPLLLLWLLPLSWAELPPPDYREALLASAEAEADLLIREGELQEALALVRGVREQIGDDARLTYEEGLILRLMGDSRKAEARYREAVAADPELATAWYDLGELLMDGDPDEAREAFEHASALTKNHPNGWAGPFRMAELAARDGDALAFDKHLKEAVRRGFRFELVATDLRWQGFLADSGLGEVLRRLMTVYGEEALLKTWEAQAAEPR